MPRTTIVIKHEKMLTESDRKYILDFFNQYFKLTKVITDIYIEEESCPQVDI